MTPDDDVRRPYEVLGEARAVDALPFTSPAEQLQQKLLLGGAEPRRERRDPGLDHHPPGRIDGDDDRAGDLEEEGQQEERSTHTTTNVEEVNELRGTLIRYTD